MTSLGLFAGDRRGGGAPVSDGVSVGCDRDLEGASSALGEVPWRDFLSAFWATKSVEHFRY